MSERQTDATIAHVPAHSGSVSGAHTTLDIRSYGITDPGRVRPQNEDQFLIAELRKTLWVRQSSFPQPATQHADARGQLLVVADGIGGEQAGERASTLAVSTIEEFVLNTLKWFFELEGGEQRSLLSELRTALQEADARVFEEGAHSPKLYGMGTTLTMAYVVHTDMYVVHAGDSRCYLLRDGALHRLTQDHTMAGELVRCGQISQEQAAVHKLRHVVTNAVGGRQAGVQVDVHKAELQTGDILLLCTDGLTEMVDDERLAAILLADADPQSACERLVAEANANGGKDNISVIVARVGACPEHRSTSPLSATPAPGR